MRIVTKKIITGCEDRGDQHSPYLTRWTFLDMADRLQACVHLFHRSDGDEMHDHPWSFVSLILWRGYVEETPCAICQGEGWLGFGTAPLHVRKRMGLNPKTTVSLCNACEGYGRVRERVWPGTVLFRCAEHVHRVELIGGKPAVTLIVMGPRVREWGFRTAKGWESFKSYFKRRGC